MIVNQKVPTFFRRNRNNSTLDLCIISELLAQSFTDCSTLDQFDSDHKPVLCRFDLRRGPKMLMLPSDSYYQDMYPVRAANIRLIPDEFGPLLEKELAKVDSQISDAPDDLWMSIEQSIIFVFKRLKLLRRKSRCIRKPWFSPEIRQLILQSNHNRTRENAAAVKKAIRTAKNNMWNSFVESIYYCDSQREVWVKFQCSRGRPAVPLFSGDLLLQANNLASKFKSYSLLVLPIHTDDVSNALIFFHQLTLLVA